MKEGTHPYKPAAKGRPDGSAPNPCWNPNAGKGLDGTSESGGGVRRIRGDIHPSLLIGLVLVFALLVWLQASAPDGQTPVPLRTSLMESIYVTALALNAELEETGRLPQDLADIGMDDETLTYVPGAEGYTLVAEEGGVQIEYRHGEDLEPYRAAFEKLLPPYPEGLP